MLRLLMPRLLMPFLFAAMLAGAPPAMATPLDAREALHLLNRLAYGPRPGDIARVRGMGWEAYVDSQLAARPAQASTDPTLEARLLLAVASAGQLDEVLVAFWLEQLALEPGRPPDEGHAARVVNAVRAHRGRSFDALLAALGAVDPGFAALGRQEVCHRLAVHFLGTAAPASLLRTLEGAWKDSGGQQDAVLRALFTSPAFRDPAIYGKRRKDGLRLMVSSVRAAGLPLANPAPLAHTLAGWARGRPTPVEWDAFVRALATGSLALAARAPDPARQASSAPPLRLTPGAPPHPGVLAPPTPLLAEAPTPSAIAMAAATRTPPLEAAIVREALGPLWSAATVARTAHSKPPQDVMILLNSEEFAWD